MINPFEFVDVETLLEQDTNAPKPKSQFGYLFDDPAKPEKANILFLGDSNTYDNATSWVGILKRNYGMKNAQVIQKNGETTKWMLDQLKSQLAKGKRYHIVFIWVGINDIYTTGTKAGKDKAVANIKEMIRLLRKAKTPEGYTPKIAVINIACDRLRDKSVRYAINEKLSDEFSRDILRLFNASIIPTRYVLSTASLPCNALSENQLTGFRKEYCADKLCHLNAKGNQVLADYLSKMFLSY